MALTKVTYSMIQDGFINVMDYGAVADGVADDTTAIANAIAAAANSTILLPAGTYLITGDSLTISNAMNLLGQPGAILKLATTASSKKLLSVSSAGDNLLISGIEFDINQPTSDSWTNIAVQINAASNVSIDNCTFTNSASSAFPAANNGYGVYLVGAFESAYINNCTFNLHRYGVITEASSTGKDVTVENCSFDNLAGDGVEINVPTGSCQNVTVVNSTFRNLGSNNAGRGFGVGASGAIGSTISDVLVSGCSFYGVDIQGIHIEDGCKRVVLRNNYFESCGTAAATSLGAAIYVAAGVASTRAISDVLIDGNIIVSASGTDYGIFTSGTYILTGLSIVNNFVNGNGYGVGITTNSIDTKVNIDGNKVKNCDGVALRYDGVSGTITNNFCFDDQSVKTQTYGLQLGANARETVVRDNNFTGNINIGIDVTGITFPKQINSVQTYQTGLSASGTAYSSWFDIADLGAAASGTVYLKFIEGTNRSTALFTISYDGSTLTGAYINAETSGTIQISSTFSNALQIAGGILQGRVFNSGVAISSTMTMEASFNGSLLLN